MLHLKSSFSRISIYAYAVVFCLVSASASAQEWTMKLSHSNPPKPYEAEFAAFSAVFKAVAEAKTGGRLRVEVYPSGSLGGSREMIEQVQAGAAQANISSSAWIAPFTNKLEVFRIPFIFPNPLVAYRVIDGPFGEYIFEEIRKETGIRILTAAADGGFTHFTNNVRSVRTPEDMEGLKMRTMASPIIQETNRALGASANVISWTELYSALQTGVVDGQDNGISAIIYGKLYEVQDYLTLTGHFYSPAPLYVNDEWFQSLPSDIQEALYEAADTAVIAARGLVRVRDATGLELLTEEGMEVYQPTPEELDKFRQAAQPVIVEQLKEDVGSELVNRLLEATEKAKQELGQ